MPTDELDVGNKGKRKNLVKVVKEEESRLDPRFWS